MDIKLDRTSMVPLYKQIVSQIRKQILSGELAEGYLLPPERKLAESIGVNRTTILNAYRELKAEKLIGSHVGMGTVVLPVPDAAVNNISVSQAGEEPIWNHFYSDYSNHFNNSEINSLMKQVTKSNVISFATGTTARENIPEKQLYEIEQELLLEEENYDKYYSPIEGFLSLRNVIANYMLGMGCDCGVEDIMVLSGSQQGIDLTARVLINPGDVIVVEEPSFFSALQAFRAVGAKVIGVPVDENGIQIEVLEQLLQRCRPKLIYTIPSFHNPSGAEMSLERRIRLVELASQYKFLILEDDAYGALYYEQNPLPSLRSMDQAGYVLYMNTFSKTLHPGLRIGWISAHPKLIQKFAMVRQVMDSYTNYLSQHIAEKFMDSGRLNDHTIAIRENYREKRDIMVKALKHYAPQTVEFNIPKGGYYIWCKLPDGVYASRLLSITVKKNVVFMPGILFSAPGQGDCFMRLNFTFPSKKDIPKGVQIICDGIREIMQENNKQKSDNVSGTTPIV